MLMIQELANIQIMNAFKGLEALGEVHSPQHLTAFLQIDTLSRQEDLTIPLTTMSSLLNSLLLRILTIWTRLERRVQVRLERICAPAAPTAEQTA